MPDRTLNTPRRQHVLSLKQLDVLLTYSSQQIESEDSNWVGLSE